MARLKQTSRAVVGSSGSRERAACSSMTTSHRRAVDGTAATRLGEAGSRRRRAGGDDDATATASHRAVYRCNSTLHVRRTGASLVGYSCSARLLLLLLLLATTPQLRQKSRGTEFTDILDRGRRLLVTIFIPCR